MEGLDKALHQCIRKRARLHLVARGLIEHDGEFVRTHACYQGVAGVVQAQPVGHPAQQLITDCMAKRVVDELEAGNVEQQHQARGAATVHQPCFALAQEQAAVGQVGERVVQGEVFGARLGLAQVGDVLDQADQQRFIACLRVGFAHQQQVALRAVSPGEMKLEFDSILLHPGTVQGVLNAPAVRLGHAWQQGSRRGRFTLLHVEQAQGLFGPVPAVRMRLPFPEAQPGNALGMRLTDAVAPEFEQHLAAAKRVAYALGQ